MKSIIFYTFIVTLLQQLLNEYIAMKQKVKTIKCIGINPNSKNLKKKGEKKSLIVWNQSYKTGENSWDITLGRENDNKTYSSFC